MYKRQADIRHDDLTLRNGHVLVPYGIILEEFEEILRQRGFYGSSTETTPDNPLRLFQDASFPFSPDASSPFSRALGLATRWTNASRETLRVIADAVTEAGSAAAVGWILQLAEWPEPHPPPQQRRVTGPGHDGEDPPQPRPTGKRKAQRHQPSGDPAPTGLHNGANVCYINAVVQALFLIPSIHVALPAPSLTPPTHLCEALRNVFVVLAQGAVEQGPSTDTSACSQPSRPRTTTTGTNSTTPPSSSSP